jgi:hypothetical protein
LLDLGDGCGDLGDVDRLAREFGGRLGGAGGVLERGVLEGGVLQGGKESGDFSLIKRSISGSVLSGEMGAGREGRGRGEAIRTGFLGVS